MQPFLDVDLALPDRRGGKVRVSYQWENGNRLFVTTDRLSAFDRIIAGVPYKGQVLNQLAAWWFAQTADIVQNHVVSVPDPNVLIARNAQPLPVEVVVRGYITGVTSTSLWQQYAAGAGLILADTKYEFGLDDEGRLMLIDEMHTPDSSRYWIADSYEERLAAGEEPESLDKEVVRRALRDAGYRGEGEPPTLPDEVWQATSARYIDTYERLTGTAFQPGAYPVGPRILENLHVS